MLGALLGSYISHHGTWHIDPNRFRFFQLVNNLCFKSYFLMEYTSLWMKTSWSWSSITYERTSARINMASHARRSSEGTVLTHKVEWINNKPLGSGASFQLIPDINYRKGQVKWCCVERHSGFIRIQVWWDDYGTMFSLVRRDQTPLFQGSHKEPVCPVDSAQWRIY